MPKKTALLLALLLLGACDQKKAGIDGYVEGEYVYIAPTSGGILQTLSVDRGSDVKAGDALFSLDVSKLQAAATAAEARLSQAQAKWNDLTKGKRPDEISVILAQKAQGLATLQNAQAQLERTRRIVSFGGASKAERDAAQAAYDAAKARVAEMEASLKVADLPAREDLLVAAKDAVSAAEQDVAQAKKSLQEAAPVAPGDGRIEDVYYRPGEYVAAGAPVVSFLPPGNVKIRFFVSGSLVPKIARGAAVKVSCGGCGDPLPAKVTFIASKAEFTPPVIYSVESREKLVFMIEAVPDEFDARLQPGLPVNVILP